MDNPKHPKLDAAMALVRKEVLAAWTKHPGSFHNAHEGFAVLHEEVDELWDEVKADTAYTVMGMKEAVQVAAMALRFIVELHDHPKGNPALRLPLESVRLGAESLPDEAAERFPITASRTQELLDYATNYGEVDENSPELDSVHRSIIVAYKRLLSLQGLSVAEIAERFPSPTAAKESVS